MGLRIKSLTTTAGYLEHAPIHFADGLTCVIGARGTCKSTVIESIRFAFNCDSGRCTEMSAESAPSTQAGSASHQGLLRATLAGGTARCTLVDHRHGETSEWTVERELEALPRVYHEGVKQSDDLSLLNRIEIYSQGDLQQIAQYGARRLDLIDRPNKDQIDALRARRATAVQRLRAIGPDLRARRAALEMRRAEVKGLDGLRATLRQIEGQRPELSAALESERAAFLRRKEVLDRARAAVCGRRSLAAQLGQLAAQETTLRAASALLAEVPHDEARTLKAGFETFATTLSTLKAAVADADSENPDELLTRLHACFESDNARYYALRKEQQDMNESLKKEDALRQQIQHLAQLEKELESLLASQQQLIAERTTLRQTIEEVGEELYRLRLQQVEQINGAHSHVVLLTLHQGTQSDEYQKAVVRLLQGSRLRSQDEVARDLADKVRPSDLVDIVEQGDAQRLASVLGRDMGQMARLVACLLDHPSLYDVEAATFEDWLEITLFVDGAAKPINQLSKGQMATALLPLILREADYPLVFDQPEDDLDNRFVYETLVRVIRDLKRKRQLIFVTHNANIPVLGEAEKVVVMAMQSPTKAAETTEGDVDSAKTPILGLLEGGPEAFRRRQQKYGDLIK
jgi:hypothetical protein